jgi:hypothetical protein
VAWPVRAAMAFIAVLVGVLAHPGRDSSCGDRNTITELFRAYPSNPAHPWLHGCFAAPLDTDSVWQMSHG